MEESVWTIWVDGITCEYPASKKMRAENLVKFYKYLTVWKKSKLKLGETEEFGNILINFERMFNQNLEDVLLGNDMHALAGLAIINDGQNVLSKVKDYLVWLNKLPQWVVFHLEWQ